LTVENIKIIGEAVGTIIPTIITDHITNIDIQSENPQGIMFGIARDNPTVLSRLDISSISPDRLNRYTHDTQVIITIATIIIILSRLYMDGEPSPDLGPITASQPLS
jgi:ABC-type lipoprotein release transport system permease subunit